MIIVRLQGGMGNQMFQYALGRALSLKYNIPLKIDTSVLNDRTPRQGFTFRNYELGRFHIKATFVEKSEIPWKYRMHGAGVLALSVDKIRQKFFPGKGTERGFAYNEDILSLTPPIYLEGYWQSYKYFEVYKEYIK